MSLVSAPATCGPCARSGSAIASGSRPPLHAGKEPPRGHSFVATAGRKGQWLVKRADLVDFLRHRKPPAVRVGYDLTLTTEKSLGVLALLGDDDDAAGSARCHPGRQRPGASPGSNATPPWRGRRASRSAPAGWTVASFRHLTSRALDPFPHHHNVVANTVVDPDGTRRALDARCLYRHAGEASALATAEMRHRLTDRLGVRWRRGPQRRLGDRRHPRGCPPRVLPAARTRSTTPSASSKPHRAEQHHRRACRASSPSTRPAKQRCRPAGTTSSEWWQRAAAIGFTRRTSPGASGARAARSPPEPTSGRASSASPAPDGICADALGLHPRRRPRRARRPGVPDAAGQPQPCCCPADPLEQLGRRVPRLRPRRRAAAHREASDRQATGDQPPLHHRRDACRPGSGSSTGSDRPRCGRRRRARWHPSTEALDAHDRPHRRAAGLVAAFCTSGHRVQCAIGRAGAGKTTAMRAAAEAWTAAGYRVVGAAVKGEAARHLGNERRHPCRDRRLVPRPRRPADQPARRPHGPRRRRGLHPLRPRPRPAPLALPTRPAPPSASSATPPSTAPSPPAACSGSSASATHADTPELRQHPPGPAPARPRRRRRPPRGPHRRRPRPRSTPPGTSTSSTTSSTLYRDVLRRWWDARRAGHDHPMVDRRNHTRRQLNRLAHQLLQAHRRARHRGDRRQRRPALRRRRPGHRPHGRPRPPPPRRPDAYVRNGALGTVVAIEHATPSETTTDSPSHFDGIGDIDLPRSFFDDHRRPRRPQRRRHRPRLRPHQLRRPGRHVRRVSTSRIDENASRAETYVDITRGRSANHLYLTRPSTPSTASTFPRPRRYPSRPLWRLGCPRPGRNEQP